MNRRLLNIILMVFMFAIWIVVIYKLFNFFKADNQTTYLSKDVIYAESSLQTLSKDTFQLNRIDRDPFLDKVRERKVNVTVGKPKQKPDKKNVKKALNNKISIVVKWPKLRYYGTIKGINSSSELILIKIDNKLFKLREGDKLEDIALKKVYRDSIIVEMNNELKSILKNQNE
ncbi:hypothetical protein N7U66_03245 [Lacinutrix neustonica]|uniref:Type II secretion system protein GspC N-terminal domain-containing protein n=1 Tax=Lacinutrix neustonica TaxID=2980107 RepID=A0A9E8MX99_9FLAO|nr:hypothetical protein [Lacinutrix neustonica]WAC02701.1 hypothetical protein N7U66_03245 [Lacinutrix neustonica]